MAGSASAYALRVRPELKAYAEYSTIGLELAASVLLGLFGGMWLDTRYGTKWCALAGFALGIGIGARAILRAARKMRVEAEREGRDDEGDRP